MLARASVVLGPSCSRAIDELPVESSLASDNRVEPELFPDVFGSATSHGPRRLSIAEQVENSCGHQTGGSGRDQQASLSVANDIAAAGHRRGHDWHSCECRLEKHPRHAFPILSRERKHIRKREQRGDVRSRSYRLHVRRMALDLGLRHRKRPFELRGPTSRKRTSGRVSCTRAAASSSAGIPFCRVIRVTVITTSASPSPSSLRS